MMDFFRKNVRTIMIVVVILFVVSCFSMYSGGRRSSGSGETQSGSNDYPVAVINGEQIMRSQIEVEVGRWLQSNNYRRTISEDELNSIRSMILDQIAVDKEFEKEIKDRGITISTAELDNAVKNNEEYFKTRELFLQFLQREGITERRFRELVEHDLRGLKVIQQVTSVASTDEGEKMAFYDTMKSFRYIVPENYGVSVAHFKTKENADDAYTKLNGGRSWTDVIEVSSADMTNYTPGSTTVTIPTSQMTGDLEYIASAPLGSPTKPFEIVSGDFMIVVKREFNQERILSYDEVSADVEQVILAEKRDALQAQFMQELRSRAKVDILDKTVFVPEKPAVSVAVSADVISSDTSPVSQ